MSIEWVKDERVQIIGSYSDHGNAINYNHVVKGLVGIYYKQTNTYVRLIAIPGRQAPFPGSGDFGVSDIRYWG